MNLTAKGKYLIASAAAVILLGLCLILTSANANARSVPIQENTQAQTAPAPAPPAEIPAFEPERAFKGGPLPTLVAAARFSPEELAALSPQTEDSSFPDDESESSPSDEDASAPCEIAEPEEAEEPAACPQTVIPCPAEDDTEAYEERIAALCATNPDYFDGDGNFAPEGLTYLNSFLATAYCDCGLTATGTTTTVGRTIAVNPDVVPYGTHLYLYLDDGTFVGDYYAEDTGGNLLRHHYLLDIYMGDGAYDQCINWGVRHVLVFIDSET